MQGVHGAVGQAGVHAPGPVGFTDHFTHGHAETPAGLAAVLDVVGQARPAAFDELLIGLLEAGRRLHAGLAPGTALGITDAVQRCQHLLTELRAFIENGIDHVRGGVFTSREALIVRLVAEQLVTYEADIAQGAL